ncbi:trichohyalin-like [Oenanthe melanoleuca]|uniref:trichohyalin-like n=1 Tax=Oenanthe melanoleuca TaxID=2939378 RepID=UPI0024C186F6|nr:trichohyalin-like [Oenanthe melanoleuca]
MSRKGRENVRGRGREKAAVMDSDPRSEKLNKQNPPRPPVSSRPEDKVLPGVPRRSSVASGGPGGMSRLEMLQRQICTLQKGHQILADELAKAQSNSEELRQKLEQLRKQKEALKESRKQLQELLQRAQLRRKEVEAKGQRCSGLCLEQHQDLQGTEQKWEQLLHLCREQRWQYCQELDAIMKELKHLHVTHTPAYLEAELVKLEEMEKKLLRWERRLLEVEEQLGPETFMAMRLLREEQQRLEQQLEEELRRQQLSQERRDRLAEELKQLQLSLEPQPE